ncbi:MAG: NAD(P)-binding protein [Kofleriaceae bacterium]|nr:NAD(P)-binding protein [Kofleriaceae bacterium]MBP6841873.1 NAD(P)-binding protein [Kofleriaceae bacterium]
MTAPRPDADVEFLVVGAGITGLGFANAIAGERAAAGKPAPEVLVIEAEAEPGGYCRTVHQDGFVWDYSGHFFHFKRPEIEAWLRERMPAGADIHTVRRRALIRFAGRDVDFPFQKNIHQLPHEDFVTCLYDLFFRQDDGQPPASFLDMLHRKFGRGIAERFLVPYNEKLYATDLGTLDVDAMGRFFPHADLADIIRNMRHPDDGGYNATFTYPAGGAIQYIDALLRDLPPTSLALGERLVAVDRVARVATTSHRRIRYRHLVSSAPLPHLLRLVGLDHDPSVYTWNAVLVFNLGFDRKGQTGVHWMYFPDRARRFYRVGWYDNILAGGGGGGAASERMSLYVEIGAPRGTQFDVEAERARVLADLAAEGIVTDHQLVSWHSVVLDPAYVHITSRSLTEAAAARAALAESGIHAHGRYGRWTYCSIEDNLIEARELAAKLV